jgi:hypothetical protein
MARVWVDANTAGQGSDYLMVSLASLLAQARSEAEPELVTAVKALLAKIALIENSSAFASAFTLAQVHGAPYRGETWSPEVSAVEAALANPAISPAAVQELIRIARQGRLGCICHLTSPSSCWGCDMKAALDKVDAK